MRNPDYFYNLTAEQLNISPELSKKVNEFYWKRIKNIVRNTEQTTIFIRNIGTLYLYLNRIKADIFETIRIIKAMKVSSRFTEEKRSVIIENYKEKIKELWILRNKALQRDNIIRQRKKQMQNEQVS